MKLKFSKKTWIIIFILICVILFFSFINTKKLFEGFDSNSRYKYLAPIPPDTVWSQETQDAYKAWIDANPNRSHLELTDAMKLVSEEEGKQFADTGIWPWDDFVTEWWTQRLNDDFAKNPPASSDTPPPNVSDSIKTMQMLYPNRAGYALSLWPAPPATTGRMPLYNIWSKLSMPSNDMGYAISDTQRIICDYDKLKIKNTTDGTSTESTDYSLFEKIPGLKFVSESFNLCAFPQKYKVTIDGKPTPEDYNIYIGASSPTESTPSSLSDSIASPLSSISSSSGTSSSKISDSNYQQLLSLCKSVLGK
jgi:hypothetical protein